MIDLFVIEGRANSGKSTLIMHLSGVGKGYAYRSLEFKSKTLPFLYKTILVVAYSPNEGENPGQNKHSVSHRLNDVDFCSLVDSLESDYYNKTNSSIDGLLVPFRNNSKSSQGYQSIDYVTTLMATGKYRFAGYAQLGRGPFLVPGVPNCPASPQRPSSLYSLAHKPPTANGPQGIHANLVDWPSNTTARLVRSSWNWE